MVPYVMLDGRRYVFGVKEITYIQYGAYKDELFIQETEEYIGFPQFSLFQRL